MGLVLIASGFCLGRGGAGAARRSHLWIDVVVPRRCNCSFCDDRSWVSFWRLRLVPCRSSNSADAGTSAIGSFQGTTLVKACASHPDDHAGCARHAFRHIGAVDPVSWCGAKRRVAAVSGLIVIGSVLFYFALQRFRAFMR